MNGEIGNNYSVGNSLGNRPMPMEQKTRFPWKLLLILILLLIIGYLMWNGVPRKQEITPGQTITQAPYGEVVSDFPKELILEENIVAQASYSITYAEEKVSQPVVSYRSAKNLTENIAMYSEYFLLNQWAVVHVASEKEAPVTYFYAQKDTADVNVTFAQDLEGVIVTISYTKRPPAPAPTLDAEIEEEQPQPTN